MFLIENIVKGNITINSYFDTAFHLRVFIKSTCMGYDRFSESIITILKYLEGFWFCVAVHKVTVP